MVLSLSQAPKIGAAIAFGLIATSIAFSESMTWNSSPPVLSPPEAEVAGPPMPSAPAAKPVNLADVGWNEGTAVPPSPGGGAYEFAPKSLGPDVIAQPTVSPTQAVAPETVRVIDLPRRDDDLDELGRPTIAPDQYQVAALPAPEAESGMEQPMAGPGDDLIAPIPAPAYRRPVNSYLLEASASEVPEEPVSMDPLVSADKGEYVQGIWPRRLDQVVSLQGQARIVEDISYNNLFLSDWVEVRNGGARRVVAQ